MGGALKGWRGGQQALEQALGREVREGRGLRGVSRAPGPALEMGCRGRGRVAGSPRGRRQVAWARGHAGWTRCGDTGLDPGEASLGAWPAFSGYQQLSRGSRGSCGVARGRSPART